MIVKRNNTVLISFGHCAPKIRKTYNSYLVVIQLPRYPQYNIITIGLLYKLIINMFGIENVNIIHFDTQLLLILYTLLLLLWLTVIIVVEFIKCLEPEKNCHR